jgi:hypothetical protein
MAESDVRLSDAGAPHLHNAKDRRVTNIEKPTGKCVWVEVLGTSIVALETVVKPRLQQIVSGSVAGSVGWTVVLAQGCIFGRDRKHAKSLVILS